MRSREMVKMARGLSVENRQNLAMICANQESVRNSGTPAEYAWNRVMHAIWEAQALERSEKEKGDV